MRFRILNQVVFPSGRYIFAPVPDRAVPFWACCGEPVALQLKISRNVAEAYNAAVFDFKKEIPAPQDRKEFIHEHQRICSSAERQVRLVMDR